MKKELLVFEGTQSCPYIDGQVARMPLYRQLRQLTRAQADVRFANSERRVGSSLYRTNCPSCNECKGIRIPVDTFKPSKSQRRVANRWSGYRIEMGPVQFSQEKLRMFNAHKRERGLQDLDEPLMSDVGYVGWLVHSCMETVEMRYYLGDRLVGVGVLDLGERSASSVYFYFDPCEDISKLSPGVFSVLQEVAFCRSTGRELLYLGLYVQDCRKLSYKDAYRPHERMVDGDWQLFT